jgi:hypothetical protein
MHTITKEMKNNINNSKKKMREILINMNDKEYRKDNYNSFPGIVCSPGNKSEIPEIKTFFRIIIS